MSTSAAALLLLLPLSLFAFRSVQKATREELTQKQHKHKNEDDRLDFLSSLALWP